MHAQEALNRIREATNGRLDIKLFPANQLGSDTDLLSQVRTGGVAFFNQSSSVLATLAPAAGIVNTGFAFPGLRHGVEGHGRRVGASCARRSVRPGWCRSARFGTTASAT